MKRNNVKLLNVASLWWLGSDFRWLPQYAFIRPTFDQNIDIMSFISILFFRKNVNYKHYTSSFISNTSCYFDRNSDLSHGR